MKDQFAFLDALQQIAKEKGISVEKDMEWGKGLVQKQDAESKRYARPLDWLFNDIVYQGR